MGAAGAETAAEVAGAEVIAAGVLEALEVASVLKAEDDEDERVTEVGVSAGQSEPTSDGRSQGMISR